MKGSVFPDNKVEFEYISFYSIVERLTLKARKS